MKPQKQSQQQNSVQFRMCDLFKETSKKFPMLSDKLKDFLRQKSTDPLSAFGASDKSFSGGGTFNKAIPGIKHAHLSQDVSIIYLVHGKFPTIIDLYGLFSHADIGTGQPANLKKQQSMSKKFKNQDF